MQKHRQHEPARPRKVTKLFVHITRCPSSDDHGNCMDGIVQPTHAQIDLQEIMIRWNISPTQHPTIRDVTFMRHVLALAHEKILNKKQICFLISVEPAFRRSRRQSLFSGADASPGRGPMAHRTNPEYIQTGCYILMEMISPHCRVCRTVKPNKLGGQLRAIFRKFANDFPSSTSGSTLLMRVGSTHTADHQQRREIPDYRVFKTRNHMKILNTA